jgi:hypothetical protein
LGNHPENLLVITAQQLSKIIKDRHEAKLIEKTMVVELLDRPSIYEL